VNIFRFKKMRLGKSKEATLIAAFCFSVMMLLGAPLHHHDIEHLEIEPDCAPFHLFESGISLETNAPDLSPLNQITYKVSQFSSVSHTTESVSFSSRAPPTYC
jgi:hypothetical protein